MNKKLARSELVCCTTRFTKKSTNHFVAAVLLLFVCSKKKTSCGTKRKELGQLCFRSGNHFGLGKQQTAKVLT